MTNVGKIVQIIGPVVDCEFQEKHLPAIYNSVIIEGDTPVGNIRVDGYSRPLRGEGDGSVLLPDTS